MTHDWTTVRRCVMAMAGIALVAVAVHETLAAEEALPAESPNEVLDDIDLFDLDVPDAMIVVSATRRAQKMSRLPYAAGVVTAEDIRRAGAQSVPDALRLVPGVDVADLSSNVWAVSPRGLHGFISSQSLVLVDGRQIVDSAFSTVAWGSWPFQVEDIERIEVIRGPSGVTWGANALHGIINIVTKDPRDQLGLTVSGGGGSRGSHKEHLGYGFEKDALRLRVSGEYEANDGFQRGGSLLRHLDDGMKTGRTGVHAIYEPTPADQITLSAGNALIDGGYPAAPAAGFGPRKNSVSQTSYLLGKWNHRIADDEFLDVVGYVNDFQLSPGAHFIDYRYQQLALQIGHSFRWADTHTLTWGIDSRTDLIDAGNSDPYLLSKDFISTAIIGLYVEDEWQFAPKWTLNVGGRVDYEFYGGFQPSGRASLAYGPTETSMLYGAVSRAFHMPEAPLRFMAMPMLNGLAMADCDRNVRAQTLIAYELGYRQRFFDRIETSASLFWHALDDITAYPPRLRLPPGLIGFTVDNHGAAALYGAELDARYAVTDHLTLLGHYTYQQPHWKMSTSILEKDVMTPPRHKFMLGARWSPTDDFHLSSHLYYVDAVKAPNPGNPLIPRHVAPYFRLDLRGEYEFWEDRASVAVGVRNLLDPHHYEGGSRFLNDAEVPRMVYAEMRVTVQ